MSGTSRWSVIAAYALVGAATQMVWLTFAAVTTVSADRYGVSVSAIGWLANVFVLMFVLLAVPAGILLDRHLRGALMLGAGLTAAGACLRLVGDDYTWLLVGGTVAALGQPLMLTGIASLARNYLAPEHRSAGIALATASTWAGFIAAFALAAVLSTAEQMPTLLVVHAGFAVLAAVVFGFTLRRPPPFADATLPSGVAQSLRALSSAWADPLVRWLCFFGFIPFGTFIALTTWTEALLEPAGVSVEMVGIILICTVLGGVIGTATLPIWASKRRKEVQLGIVAVVVTAVVCAILAFAPGAVTGITGLTLTAFLLLPMLAIVLEIVERGSETEGVASGMVWAVGNLGGLVVSTLIGFTVDNATLSFLLMGAVTLLALPILARLRAPVAALPDVHEVVSGTPQA